MKESNSKSRLEAFCDGVFAIAITLLVIDIKLPPSESLHSNAEIWSALHEILPSIAAFILSFIIILITWVNHHGHLKMVGSISAPFIFANGFLLLTVAFLPFPNALLGEFILTDHASPAVILYNSTLALQALSWICIYGSASQEKLFFSEQGKAHMKKNLTFGIYAFITYSVFAVLAIWIPQIIALFTLLTWLFWLTMSLRIKHNEFT